MGALALLWVAAHALADRDSVRARLRDRAAAVLATRLPTATLGDEVAVDWLFRATVGPLTIPATTPGAKPVVIVERITVRVAWLPLLAGRIEPASVKLLGVQVVPGPGGRELLGLVKRLRRAGPTPSPGAAAARHPVDPVVQLRALTVLLEVGSRTVELGPVDLRLERTLDRGQETLAAELGLQGGGHAEATLHRARPPDPPAEERPGARPRPSGGAAPRPWSLTAHLAASAADLPAALRGRAVAITGGVLRMEAEAEGTESGGGRATLRGDLAGLELSGASIGQEPIGPLAMSGEASLEGSVSERRIWLRRGVVRPAGPVTLEATGTLTASEEPTFELAVKLLPFDLGELLAALPRGLAPGPEAPHAAGAVGGALSLAGPLRAPEAWTVRAEVDLAALRQAARGAPPSPLRKPFTVHPAGDDGPAILLGSANPDFVPIAELPEHVVRAVTTSEDAGFFGHQGFDFDELRNAAVAGARAGRLMRGGSTITQQLAKNLFLSRDRTLARKAKEALVTVALEGTVPKARLLEIYLNLIEWGPGLHGIGPAARHYLGKDARALTPREACFLATLIPSPLRSHAALAAGVPTERWNERIDDLLRKLGVTGVLDEASLTRELEAPLGLAAWVPRSPAAGLRHGEEPPLDREDGEAEAVPEEGGDTQAPTPTSTPTPRPTSTSTPSSTPTSTAIPAVTPSASPTPPRPRSGG